MDVAGLWTLQCMMFLLAAFGAILKRKGILKEESRGIITDLVMYGLLPCNIINSFRMEFDLEILKRFALVLGISMSVQVVSYGLSRVLYNHKPDAVKRVLQYCTIVSNSGFLGLPIVEGVFGAEGMMYASVYIIPMRVMMWSAGIACFTTSPDMKSVVKKIAVHPCIVAVYIGLGLMFLQVPLGIVYGELLQTAGPLSVVIQTLVLALDKAVKSLGGCTTAITMILIGTMLADMKLKDMVDPDALLISVVRLGLLPGMLLAGCRIFGLDPLLAGICVLITGMPAGSTSAILAAKYGCDYMFATKCVVVSTLLSMLTIPLWCMVF